MILKSELIHPFFKNEKVQFLLKIQLPMNKGSKG